MRTNFALLLPMIFTLNVNSFAAEYKDCTSLSPNEVYAILPDGKLAFSQKDPSIVNYVKTDMVETLKYKISYIDPTKWTIPPTKITVVEEVRILRDKSGKIIAREQYFDKKLSIKNANLSSQSSDPVVMVREDFGFNNDNCYLKQSSAGFLSNPKELVVTYDSEMCQEMSPLFNKMKNECSETLGKLSGVFEKYRDKFSESGKKISVAGGGSTIKGANPFISVFTMAFNCSRIPTMAKNTKKSDYKNEDEESGRLKDAN